jgi:2-C-methyl-D-erythritol 4-phosphate cytidylyltransferase/2-C-methyl-D-erythritol 2,4-cyclodiphosphate synthase
MRFHAVIVAGGSGSRSGGKKQWMPLGGRPVLDWSVEAFAEAGAGRIVIVVPADDVGRAGQAYPNAIVVAGGADRAASVVGGLKALEKAADERDVVMIHDAARPLLNTRHINSLLKRLETADAAILALPLADSLKRAHSGMIAEAVPRDYLWRAQTPQCFRLGAILGAYAAWSGDAPTDEATVAAGRHIAVALVEGDMRLHKLTYPEDFVLLEALIAKDKAMKQTRIGQGFDAHRWGDGQAVWLCGIEIAHDKALIGHSDADAGLHALTDALLGAAGLGDIGDHFPPTDPRWKGASSDRFLRHAADLIARKGGEIVNVDVTLICERPKIKPHREAMRLRVAQILGIDPDRVSIKATTTERMGFTGREEGLAAQAVASVLI